MIAVAGLLTRHQKLYVQRMSQIVLNESSDPESNFNSDNDKDAVTHIAFERSLKKMVRQSNMTDKRFIDLHRVSQALRSGATLNPNYSKDFDVIL